MKKQNTIVIVWGFSIVAFMTAGFIMGWAGHSKEAALQVEQKMTICTKRVEVLQEEVDDLERVLKLLGFRWAGGKVKCVEVDPLLPGY